MSDWDPKANEIYLRAAEAESDEDRAEILDAACGADAGLRARVESLLAAHAAAGSFLESRPPGVAVAATQLLPHSGPHEPASGDRIGPYTLQQKLGEGGMGTVWAAEQQAPVRRRVALKLIKPGMDSVQVLRRFDAERQALALMDHTNIAKVFDAGTTPDGRPFFAMELVKGVPITKYCDELNLSIAERLQLLLPVCQAIQHAHQKGIIHRDIKPSNVLVCIQDDRPMPKVIDFGVAKALHQRLADRTMYTEIGAVIGTLEYMAPEQAELSSLDVDTRADVFALGALLYELLTGSTPLDRKRLAAAGLAEVMRIIREDEPPRPSTRLSESKETLPTLAAHRRAEPGKLTKEVRGDLDWIVMKCLEKDRTRRYETANALVRDIERHLADEPVEARPPGRGYRLRKFARRHRAALAIVVAAAAAMLLLVAGLAVSNRVIAGSRNETAAALLERERALASARASAENAEIQRQRAEGVSRKVLTAVHDLLISPSMSRTEWSQIPLPLRRKFRDEAAKFYASLPVGENTDPALRYETAVGQRALGYLYQQSDGVEQAEEILRKSVHLLEALHRESPENVDYAWQLALSHETFFRVLWSLRRLDEAEVSARRAIDLYEEAIAERFIRPNGSEEVSSAYLYLGTFLAKERERADEAEQMNLRAIKILEQYAAHITAESFPTSDQGRAYDSLAGLQIRFGKTNDAAATYDRGLKADPGDPRRWYIAAALYLSIGDIDRYRGACRELLDLAEKLTGKDVKIDEWAAKTCALAPESVPNFSRVESLAQRVITGTENHAWRRNFILAKALVDYRGGRPAEAVEGLQRFAPQINGEHFDATAYAALAMAYHQLGREDQARESLQAARAIIAKKPPSAMSTAFWFDWLHCETLLREAEDVVK